MSQFFVFPINTALDIAGESIAYAKLYFYQATTSTPLDVYANDSLSTSLANPVVADGAGRFPRMYMQNQLYKVTFTDADDAVQWTLDNVNGIEATPSAGWIANDYIKRNSANTGWDSKTSSQVWADISVAATTSLAGIAELATQAEVDAGTSTNTIVTPATLKSTVATASFAPSGYIFGMELSNGTDANHDIDVSIGVVRSHDKTVTLSLASVMTKLDDADWMIGTGNGGMPAKVTKTGNFTTSTTAVTGIGTLFTTEFQVNDILWSTSNGEGRRITLITNANNMTLESAYSVDVSVAEAAKINGLAKNATYGVYALGKTDGTTDVGYDTRVDASLLLADINVVAGLYTKYGYLGSIMTDSSANIVSFKQKGDRFTRSVQILDLSISTASTAGTLIPLTIPLGRSMDADIFCFQVSDGGGGATNGNFTLITSPFQANTAPTVNQMNLHSTNFATDWASNGQDSKIITTDTSGRIRHRTDTNTNFGSLRIWTKGWYDMERGQ